jgi:hypothetical protein
MENTMTNEPNKHYGTLVSGTQWGVIAHIKPISSPVPPPNWALCDGSACPIDRYPALFAIIGARFGGDGVTTFKLPDLVGEHHFVICFDGYFPLEGRPLPEWQLGSALDEYIQMRVLSLRESYAQGADPFYRHRHTSQLDPAWLEMQAQVLQDAYAREEDPLHRHPHMSEVDPEWLERQVQVFKDAHARGQDPMRRHAHVSELDPEWLEMHAQVLVDAYARGEDPLHRHTHMSDLDPEWLERQVQVLNDAHMRGQDPMHRHTHVSNLDPEWLERQAQVLKDAYSQGKDPLHRHAHVDDHDPEWLKMQARVLHDAYARGHDPLHRHLHESHLDPEWLEGHVRSMQDAYARGEDPLSTPRSEDPAPDDLERIEGIGPKISALLQEAGVTTFAQLRATEVAELNTILDTAGIHFADPGTWPEQAGLAAAGQWDKLTALQDELKGGRRT